MKKYLYAAALAATLASCSGWLDLKPYDGVVEDDYWKTKEDVHSMVIGCYSSLLNKALVSNMIYWGELRADLVTDGPSADAGIKNIIRGEISPENGIVKWDEFYNTINQCNKIIEKSELVRELDQTFTESLYRQYVAEVTAIRSLMYFYLVRSFQDVPLVLTASNSDAQDYYPAKAKGSDILDTLVSHLVAAIPRLPRSYGAIDKTKGRFTDLAAKTLLADIYLWQGSYESCNSLCVEVIGSGQFSLIPVGRESVEVRNAADEVVDTAYYANMADVELWFDQLYVTGNSVESIFELQFPKVHESLNDPFFAMYNSSSSRPVLAANDAILDGVLFPVYEYDLDVRDIRRNTYQQGYAWKFVGAGLSGTRRTERSFPHWIIYRFPDVMLMRAEALTQLAIQSGNRQDWLEEAYGLVQQVRERANAVEGAGNKMSYPINGKTLEKLILEERAREFVFEGKRWYDVLRHARRDNYAGENREYLLNMAINSAPPEKQASLQVKYLDSWFHYWPIYVGAVEINRNLTQNEFYLQ
ncbi:MAG: RagB/SusD family nutrient uptake outer membrane protein [Prevotellaceae bacterium]|jgi:hypothetical protein|nr:RagB/SusD family nutrient uptake outer membrane protein [Prevotellaceae bacterium]